MPVVKASVAEKPTGADSAPQSVPSLAAVTRVPSKERSLLRFALSQSTETYIALGTAGGIFCHLALRYLFALSRAVYDVPLFATLALGGGPLLFGLGRKIAAREFGSDLLAGVSILSSILLGQYLVGAIVVLMLSGGAALEHFATRRASAVLDELARRTPQTAHLKRDSTMLEIALSDIAIGDILVVLPHEICPVDGTVVEGRGVMDESYLTGEPFEMSKTPGSKVLSGAINGETALTVVADKLAVDSRYARIVQVIQTTEQNRPQLRRLGDRLGAWYTPVAVGLAGFAWISTHDPLRFLAVVVVATPCPLLIAIPVAVIGAISLSARHGIIIKNPGILEQITTCRTLIFDKTGTLTYGHPTVTGIHAAAGFSGDEVLQAAASLERYSKHPLAAAILNAAREAGLRLQSVGYMSEKPGEGLEGEVEGRKVRITGRRKLEGRELRLPPAGTGLECVVLIDERYAALITFHDAPRYESQSFVRHLKPSHDVSRVMLVSGDRESEVQYLAKMVGITEIRAGQSPEDKVAIVREETQRARTLFVGDGINDAPALIAATVGVAFGPNSDITSEAADAVIMTSSLSKVDELIHISGRMRTIALQSAIGGMMLSIAGMIAAAIGYLPPLEGAVAQEIIDLVAVLNAVRVALPTRDMADF